MSGESLISRRRFLRGAVTAVGAAITPLSEQRMNLN
jgi:hypothetical protein